MHDTSPLHPATLSRAAELLLEIHGPEAPFQAAALAARMRQAGKSELAAMWEQVSLLSTAGIQADDWLPH